MKKLYEEADIQAIADAIRSKVSNFQGNKFKVAGMASAINKIPTEDSSITEAIIDKSISEISTNNETIGAYSFYNCETLTSISFPNAKTVENSAFGYCKNLENIDIPKVQTLMNAAFAYCYKIKSFENESVTDIDYGVFLYNNSLETISTPNVKRVGTRTFGNCEKLKKVEFPKVTGELLYTFANCYELEYADFPAITSISAGFSGCKSLKALILRNTDQIVADTGYNGWYNCYHLTGTTDATYNPNGDKDGYFYVPKALLEEYKVATNWTVYADRFRAIEDYSSDGTVAGDIVVS